MKDNDVRQLVQIRDAMVALLSRGQFLTTGEMADKIGKHPQLRQRWTADRAIYLIGLAVRVYGHEFYRDPSTGRIFLTQTAKAFQALKRKQQTGSGHRVGTTAAARIAEALEANGG